MLQCSPGQVLLSSAHFLDNDGDLPSDANVDRKSEQKNYHFGQYHHLCHFMLIDQLWIVLQ
jgi:hypothetical protein